MPKARAGKISDAQRKAQNKYEAKTYKTIGCKLPIVTAEKFIEMVRQDPAFMVGGKEEGSVNAAFVQFVTDYMNKHQQ